MCILHARDLKNRRAPYSQALCAGSRSGAILLAVPLEIAYRFEFRFPQCRANDNKIFGTDRTVNFFGRIASVDSPGRQCRRTRTHSRRGRYAAVQPVLPDGCSVRARYFTTSTIKCRFAEQNCNCRASYLMRDRLHHLEVIFNLPHAERW